MNCRQAEKWLLLKDAGELPFRKQLRLEQHLALCASCRAFQDDLGQVMSVARRNPATGKPDGKTLVAIRTAASAGIRARDVAVRRRVREQVIIAWRPIPAIAAVFLLCLGGWYWLNVSGSSSVGLVTAHDRDAEAGREYLSNGEFDELSIMLVEDVIVVEWVSDLVSRAEISSLDRELLLLEGLAI